MKYEQEARDLIVAVFDDLGYETMQNINDLGDGSDVEAGYVAYSGFVNHSYAIGSGNYLCPFFENASNRIDSDAFDYADSVVDKDSDKDKEALWEAYDAYVDDCDVAMVTIKAVYNERFYRLDLTLTMDDGVSVGEPVLVQCFPYFRGMYKAYKELLNAITEFDES